VERHEGAKDIQHLISFVTFVPLCEKTKAKLRLLSRQITAILFTFYQNEETNGREWDALRGNDV